MTDASNRAADTKNVEAACCCGPQESEKTSAGADGCSCDRLAEEFSRLRRLFGRMLIAVVFMALAVFVLAAVVFGDLVNYMAGDALLMGGGIVGGAVVGFFFGLFAGRRM